MSALEASFLLGSSAVRTTPEVIVLWKFMSRFGWQISWHICEPIPLLLLIMTGARDRFRHVIENSFDDVTHSGHNVSKLYYLSSEFNRADLASVLSTVPQHSE